MHFEGVRLSLHSLDNVNTQFEDLGHCIHYPAIWSCSRTTPLLHFSVGVLFWVWLTPSALQQDGEGNEKGEKIYQLRQKKINRQK